MKKILNKLIAIGLVVQAMMPQLSTCTNATGGEMIIPSRREVVNDLNNGYFLYFGRSRKQEHRHAINFYGVDRTRGTYRYVMKRSEDYNYDADPLNSVRTNLVLLGRVKDTAGLNSYVFKKEGGNDVKYYIIALENDSIVKVTTLPKIK